MLGKTNRRHDRQPASAPVRRSLACSALVGLLTLCGPVASRAYDCPAARQPNIPASEEPAVNIDKHKKQLRAYHTGAYNDDIKLVLDDALTYVQSRADKVTRPAVVLDIDETSLTNWRSIDADDFGFIRRRRMSAAPDSAMRLQRMDQQGQGQGDRPDPEVL